MAPRAPRTRRRLGSSPGGSTPSRTAAPMMVTMPAKRNRPSAPRMMPSERWSGSRRLGTAATGTMVVPVPWLERVPTYKEQQENLKDKDLSSIGFLGYPLLQTADVTMYDARFVPVGEDQVAHLELAREVVRRFNNVFGKGEAVLVEPEPLLTASLSARRLPGLDGDKKMSKSLGNTIHLSDTPEEVTKKVRQMYTDPKRIRADIPGTVEGNPVFIYHDAFNPDTAEVDDLKDRYRNGKVGDVEVKTKLARALNAHLDPIRERRSAVLAKPDHLRDILLEGSRRARAVALDTMARVRDAVKISYS